MNSLVLLLAVLIPGCWSFTTPLTHTRRIAFVAKPFYVASTELKADETQDAAPVTEDGKRVVHERHTAFLGNLPFEITDDEISDLCAEFGSVVLVNVPKNRENGRPRGFAFVDMSSAEELQAVVSGVDGKLVKGRSVRVSISDPSQKQEKKPEKKERRDTATVTDGKIYVGNLPFGTTKEDLLEFYNQYATTVEAYIPINEETGEGRGFAFVTLKPEDVDVAIEKTNGMEFLGRPLVVNKPLKPGQRATRRPTVKDLTKLYVGNLAFSTDVEILEEVFGEFGEVHDCYMPEDPARGGSRGFGFVTMSRDNAMEAIAELNGCELDGRFIRVNEALPKGKSDGFEDGVDV